MMFINKYEMKITTLFVAFIAIFFMMNYSVDGQIDTVRIELDSTHADYWRKAGYESRIDGRTEQALQAYLRVLQIDSPDWDANLAVARLYFELENYHASLQHYNNILSNDTTDVEALWGIGRCYFRTGEFGTAVNYYRKASVYLPDYSPILLDLASAFTNDNKLKEALNVYHRVIALDSTNIDALSGLGKLYYWSGKPYKSTKYYERAFKVDPINAELKQQLDRVKREMALNVNYQFHFVNENEPVSYGSDTLAYNIDALIQRLSISKRMNDFLYITVSGLIDHSVREYSWQDTEKRWFDNSYIKSTFLGGNHKIHLYAGYSKAEDQFSSYGIGWDYSRKFGKFRLSNSCLAGYDYYYYWNDVGHDFITNQLKLEYKNIILEGVYRFANVRELYILDLDTIGRNKGTLYTISGRYSFLKNPRISVGLYHQFRDYQYRSPKYWSPQDRKLNGLNTGIYWKISKKLYFYGYGNIGKDNYDIKHWEASSEIGFTHKTFSFSGGVYRFYNPWYESFDAYLSLTKTISGK
jgi:tetratricopeptide (TPR) repeat protein